MQFWLKFPSEFTHCVAMAAVGVADILLVRPVDCLILTAAEAEVSDGIFSVFLFDSCVTNYEIMSRDVGDGWADCLYPPTLLIAHPALSSFLHH